MQGRSSGVLSVPQAGQGAPGGGPARKMYVRIPIASESPTLPLVSGREVGIGRESGYDYSIDG